LSDLIIKIEDEELDLSSDETIAITKQAAKVGDFSTVLADGTNEVKVPLTPSNRLIMDNAHLIDTDSAKPYGRLEAKLIQEGYETIQDGYAIIKSSSDDYSLQLIGGNASFFNLIKDAELRSLPLSDYDHFWTNQEVFDRRNETEGLIYAVFEQSEDDFTMDTYSSTPNDRYAVNTDQILPSFYIKTLVDKIFEAQGYTFETDLVTEDIYDKAVVARREVPDRGTDMSHHNCTVTNDVDYPVINPINAAANFPFATVTGDSEYSQSPDLVSNIESDGRFFLTDNCRITVDFEIIVDSPYSSPNTSVLLDVFYTTANGIVNFQTEEVEVPFGISTYETSFTIDCNSFEDEIYFYAKVASTLIPSLEVLSGSSFTVRNAELISNTKLNQTTFPYNYITGAVPVPDMKQGEFLKELAKVYQWVFDTDERTKTVTARRFDEIKDNIPQALDFSDKLHSENIKIDYGIKGFAQTNALRYQEDDISEYDAVGYINVSDTTLKAEKDYVKMSEFAATSTRLRFGNVAAPYVPTFAEGLPTNGLKDRLLLVRRETFSENINFSKVGDPNPILATDDVTFAYFAEAGNNDSLDFPTLVNRFYQTVIDMNDRGKTVECKMNLKIKDVIDYDPFKPIYISSMGNYFYWEKVSNYVKDKLTKCIFVRI